MFSDFLHLYFLKQWLQNYYGENFVFSESVDINRIMKRPGFDITQKTRFFNFSLQPQN